MKASWWRPQSSSLKGQLQWCQLSNCSSPCLQSGCVGQAHSHVHLCIGCDAAIWVEHSSAVPSRPREWAANVMLQAHLCRHIYKMTPKERSQPFWSELLPEAAMRSVRDVHVQQPDPKATFYAGKAPV